MTERRVFAADWGLDIDSIDPRAIEIVLTLQDAGFEAYIVGGGVRDLLLGKHPKDFDVATSAHPEEIKNLFKNCRLIGRRFRLAHVFFRNHIIEVATFRADHTQADHEEMGSSTDAGLILRDNVFGTIEEDAYRRDFTINALYYDPASEEILDFTGGLADLKSRTLRLIGIPEKRFQEDPVRLLRAARFVGKLNLQIEPETLEAMNGARALLDHASSSRLFDEYSKLFLYGHAKEVFSALASLNLLNFLFPNLALLGVEPKVTQIIDRALLNTDARIEEGKSINPAFLLAVFLWHPMLIKQEQYQSQSNLPAYEAYLNAVNDVLSEQVNAIAVPKRFTEVIREIWQMQYLLEKRRPRQVISLLHHKRFRAAYDFLLLRAEVGEVSLELADWWTSIQGLTISAQKEKIRELSDLFLSTPASVSGSRAESISQEPPKVDHGEVPKPDQENLTHGHSGRSVWSQLSAVTKKHKVPVLKNLFLEDPNRFEAFSISVDAVGILLDFSKNKITHALLNLLLELAHESGLDQKIEALFSGACVNTTENRPALHMACRGQKGPEDGFPEAVMDKILAEKNKMQVFVDQIHSGDWLGETGQCITEIVNLGIGGSDLGPHLVVEALKPYWTGHVNTHFVSNIDGFALSSLLPNLDPAKTLFIVASKSFSTQETLKNAETARKWVVQKLGSQAVSKHFISITAKPVLAEKFGMSLSSCFEMWDFVGGRYSLWSAIGLPIALKIGMGNFEKLLAGARAMDQHFKETDFGQNLPVILGLLGVFYRNLLGFGTHAVLPYDERLALLPSYLQQLDMESNGKRVSESGEPFRWETGPVIWGGVGTNGQHAFHQFLHQGTSVVPADFILVKKPHHELLDHHEILLSHALAQMQALMQGKTEQEAYEELLKTGVSSPEAKKLAPHKVIPGNKPSNAIILESLTPESLGALIALYEHKVFVQSVIWGINPFDQWGVELGKQLAGPILQAIQEKNPTDFDSSTVGLIQKIIA